MSWHWPVEPAGVEQLMMAFWHVVHELVAVQATADAAPRRNAGTIKSLLTRFKPPVAALYWDAWNLVKYKIRTFSLCLTGTKSGTEGILLRDQREPNLNWASRGSSSSQNRRTPLV